MNSKESILSGVDISKRYTERFILRDVTLGISSGERIGLIGNNGSGKTTLLHLIAGLDLPDSGTFTRKKNLTIDYLPQEPLINLKSTLFEHIYHSDNPDFVLLREYHKLSEQLAYQFENDLLIKQQKLYSEIERKGAWSVEYHALAILNKLGFTRYDIKANILSGGQLRKLDLARVLTYNPDLLLLDEPTNHLDTDIIEWLQDHLINYQGTVIFVTHDRYFLDSVSTRIIEIEDSNIHSYKGTYSFYLQQKELQIQDRVRKESRRASQLKKELKWLARGAKARTSKPKDHVDRVMELLDKSYLTDDKDIELTFPSHRLGKTILEIGNISKSYDLPLFEDFSHIFQKHERIGIIGNNGTGKTTLLKILTGELRTDSGNIKKGINTHFAVFEQQQEDLPADMTVTGYIKSVCENIRTSDGKVRHVSEVLERFNFTGKEQQRKLSTLSGGEKKRLQLLKSLIFGANFIILDEPTNDLDIRTLEILEDYLDSFEGCLLVVSHDRFFLDRTIDYLFIFDGVKIRKFAGNYSDYLLVKKYFAEENLDTVRKSLKKRMLSRPEKKSNKPSFKVVRELQQLETNISDLEKRKADLDSKIATESNKLKAEEFKKISDELYMIEKKYLEYLERWEKLSSHSNN
ncbi:MAG: ABC-F family ATP-binding cassette domain-containing protein [Candidatus Cloacimonetes bacterium]|nr:ABC-F family ATP-binding cassette domain-containing protein [Candidatus Cloacimonadota bacterium]